jgi:PAS domain-containing protein
VKSADQIQLEAALAAGAIEAAQPDEDAPSGVVFQMTRVEAVARLRQLEAKVDRLADRIVVLQGQGREKRANRRYAEAVRLQAEANDIREALESPVGAVVREMR